MRLTNRFTACDGESDAAALELAPVLRLLLVHVRKSFEPTFQPADLIERKSQAPSCTGVTVTETKDTPNRGG